MSLLLLSCAFSLAPILSADLHGHDIDVDVVHGLIGDEDRVLDVVVVDYVRDLLPLNLSVNLVFQSYISSSSASSL